MIEVKGKYFHRSAVTQLTNEGIDCLSKIRQFCEGTMVITRQDAQNLLDGLNAWGEDDYGLESNKIWENNPIASEKIDQICDLKGRLLDYIRFLDEKDK